MATTLTRLAAAVAASAAALALALPSAAAPQSRADRAVHWYRWHAPATRTIPAGSTAVLGLTSLGALEPLRSRYGFEVLRTFGRLHAAAITVTSALRAHAADPRIRYLSPLGPARRLSALPNDPLLSSIDRWMQVPSEWQFGAAHVDRALELSPGSPSVVVGTIDSGAADVPDLRGKVDQRWSASRTGKVTRDATAFDLMGHGTAVASLIAANTDDGFGMAGFGGRTHVIAIRAWSLTDAATAAALMKLDSLGVRIVNLSFGSDAPTGPLMLDAMHKAAADGMLLIAAAGNSSHTVAHPAADLQPANGGRSYGLAVGASDAHDGLAFFSNSGANLSLLAPGSYDGPCSGVLVAVSAAPIALDGSCYPTWSGSGGAQYAYVAGTSFAAPEVAGVAALIWAARPELTNDQVADIIKASARRDAAGWTPTAGCGVLDAGAAVELALRGPASAGTTPCSDQS